MATLTQEDLKNIGDFQTKTLMQFWDEVLEPKMVTKDELQNLETRLTAEIGKRPTIAQIDHKLDAMVSRLREAITDEPLQRDKVLDRKGNTIASKLLGHDVFSQEDVKEIERVSPFVVRQVS